MNERSMERNNEIKINENNQQEESHNVVKQTLREIQEQREHEFYSPFASFSDRSKGRENYEEACDVRTVYQRDRDRILHAKSFRRLKDKTQVFLSPQGDHYRTRLTHTLEVSQNARTIARALRLNEDLTEAVALGHDLGHTPFGHAGERALNKICKEGFSHNLQSIRVVELLEKHGKGLNLTAEVKDGIKNHQTKSCPSTLEGKIVRLSDKIAYMNHDIDDAIRAGIITEESLPEAHRKILGGSYRERLNSLIHDIITNSEGINDISMSQEAEQALFGIRNFMFEHVYSNSVAKNQEDKAENLLIELFEFYYVHSSLLPEEFHRFMEERGESKDRVICDYIAGMSDRFAIAKYRELKIPFSWSN